MKNRTKDDSSQSLPRDLIGFIFSFLRYSFLRIRQFIIYMWAFVIWIIMLLGDTKGGIVKRMFWGRSSFYKSAFQFSVGLLTIVIAIGGLAGRLNLFSSSAFEYLEFPSEQLGDADYLDESASIQAIVADSSLSRGFDVQKYVVQKGDTLASIADKFGISTDTIRWSNGIVGDYIKVGQELEILPINGVIHTVKKGDSLESIATKYEAAMQDIFDINWLESKVLMEGQQLLVPNGRMPQPKPVVKPPVVTASSPPPTYSGGGGGGTGSFVRPCGCGRITNWFSAWHGGVDIAQAGGCTTVAADGGTVTMARWYGAGGLQIMIDHGNGFVTLYAHHASIYVREGQKVTRGQPIGYMGCTGRCTGTHLHFGVQRNGVWVNPLAYVPI
ncbi:M23 family metallopeptidase [Candidatus Dojkabacteria bacterium]|nr:M23 family metallopeptidase [Candidatus Dojkabacteria bacterium]